MSPLAALPASPPPASVVVRADPAPHGWRPYVVRAGDTLESLAINHHSTVADLLAKNRLRGGGHLLLVGQHLSLPRTRAATTPAAASGAPRPATYVVVRGDTVSAISARLGASQSALLRLNHLTAREHIFPGQRLRLPTRAAPARRAAPSAAKAARPATTYSSYIVRAGDTVSAIALRMHLSQASVLKANRITASSMLLVGQRLRLPTSPGRSAPTALNTFAGRTYADAVVKAADANRRGLATTAVPSRTQTKALIAATARRHGVDPKLALAIAWQESGWNQRQVSVANAIGVMQVIPSSGVWASQLSGQRLSLLDTRQNITAGVVIIRALSRATESREEAIAGYYQGLSSVRKHGMYADTKAYVRAVLAHHARM